MPTSFEAMHEETRPLALLEDAPRVRVPARCAPGLAAVALAAGLGGLVLLL